MTLHKLEYPISTKYPYKVPDRNMHPKGCGIAGCYKCEESHIFTDPHCTRCDGSGWLLTSPRGNSVMACTAKGCHQDTLNGLANDTVFDRKTGINRKKTFSNFLGEISGVQKPLEYSKQIADGTAKFVFLTICGSFGSGKTHLAYAIGNVWANRGFKFMMYPVQDLLSKMRMGMKDDTLEYLVKQTKELQGLILDDYRSEYYSDWAISRLEEIINYRYESMLLTVVTTNNNLGQLPGAVASRLCDKNIGCVVENKSDDYRIKSSNHNIKEQ
jgi:DNA replication protein DnaC